MSRPPRQLRLFDFEAATIRARDRFECVDCRADIFDEYYVVRDDAWPIDSRAGMLCIGCLEGRIGRRLNPGDFADVPINREHLISRSARLRARMGMDA